MSSVALEFDEEKLSEHEISAIETLRANGWVVVASPYVEDAFGCDPNFEEGRHTFAVCKA